MMPTMMDKFKITVKVKRKLTKVAYSFLFSYRCFFFYLKVLGVPKKWSVGSTYAAGSIWIKVG